MRFFPTRNWDARGYWFAYTTIFSFIFGSAYLLEHTMPIAQAFQLSLGMRTLLVVGCVTTALVVGNLSAMLVMEVIRAVQWVYAGPEQLARLDQDLQESRFDAHTERLRRIAAEKEIARRDQVAELGFRVDPATSVAEPAFTAMTNEDLDMACDAYTEQLRRIESAREKQ